MYQLVVSTSVSDIALSLCAKTTRVAEMDKGTTITSLTSLLSPRHPALSFGAIDASADTGVVLDVSVAGDSSSSESANRLPSGRALGHSMLRGSIPSQSFTANLLQGRDFGGMTGSVALANASFVQSPSAQTLPSPSPQSTALSTSFQTPQSASPQPPRSVGTMPQGGSTSNTPTASKINGLPA